MSIIQRRRDNTKEKTEDIKYYENGAHFKYIELFKSLVNLVSILPAERLGHNGIYFQHDDTDSKLDLSLLYNMKSHKSLIHIVIPKSMKKSPVKYSPTIKHTNTKNIEPRMNTFGNYNNRQSFRINVRLKKVNKNINIRLPKLCSPSKGIKLLYSSKIKNNTTLFSKYNILSSIKSQRNETNNIHFDTFTFENNLKMKYNIN